MKSNHPSANEWGGRILVALLFTTIAGLIMIVFSPWGAGSVLSRIDDYLAKIQGELAAAGSSDAGAQEQTH
jgi:hypothetical protein